MRTVNRKISLGVVIGSRAFFSPAPCLDARNQVLAQLEKLGVNALILPMDATANGAVQLKMRSFMLIILRNTATILMVW